MKNFILTASLILSHSLAYGQFLDSRSVSIKNAQMVTENGETYTAQSATDPHRPHSLRVSGLRNAVYDFRVEKGDQWWLEIKNQKLLERSELKHNKDYPHDGYIWQSYSFKIEEHVADAWQVIGQWHGTKGSKGRSPYIAFQISGDKLLLLRRSLKESEVVTSKTSLPLVMGQWQNVVIRSKTGKSDGSLRVWINGKLAVSHDGALGYMDEADRGYWKFGIYRSNSERATQVKYTNMRIGKISLRDKILNPDLIKE